MAFMDTIKWTRDEAINLIKLLQPFAYQVGFAICLGGSVLTKGQSKNDCDLIFHKLQSLRPHNHRVIIEQIIVFGFKLIGVSDHRNNKDDKLVYIFTGSNKRKLDLFFVDLLITDKIEEAELLYRRTPKNYDSLGYDNFTTHHNKQVRNRT